MASALNVAVTLVVIRPSVEISPDHVAIMGYFCSFKIFPQFWLAKRTRIIHHNQLLMTKFGRILYLT